MSANISFDLMTISEEDTETVVKFLQTHFYKHEPLNVALYKERSERVDPDFRGNYVIHIIAQGMSLKAVAPSGEIVGVVLNKTLTEDASPPGDDHPNFVAISKILNKVEDEMKPYAKPQNESTKIFIVQILCVHNDWMKKGLGKLLVEKSREIAIRNGFGQMRSICTSAYSTKIFDRLEFKCVYSLKYENYIENEEVVFKTELPHTHINGMVLDIS